MELWLALAVLTAAVLIAVLRPLLRPAQPPPPAVSADLAVYRDQLAEIDAERARGLLADAEAAAARTEIARRLLATAPPTQRATVSSVPSRRGPQTHARGAAMVLALATPLAAAALYLALGAPHMPSQPLSARKSAPVENATVLELVARVEARLQAHPEDGRGWDVIAPVYFSQGRYLDAAQAFSRATSLLGASPKRLAGFAESTVRAHDGVITEPARLAYEKLAQLDPAAPGPRFWLALAKEQGGQHQEAAAAYEALLNDGGVDATARSVIDERLTALRSKLAAGGASKPAPERGPTGDDIAAAGAMTPEARAQFIEQMVAGLAQRLKGDGRDLAGWQRLIRAYVVLGRSTDAANALADARANFTSEPKSLAELDAFAKSLGLGS